MFQPSKRDVKLIKRIYSYITPVIITSEYIQDKYYKRGKRNKNLRSDNDDVNVFENVFELIGNMRHTACHDILNGYFIEELFVNMVKLYEYFGLDLLTKDFVEELWNKDNENDNKFKICTLNENPKTKENKKDIKEYELPDVKTKCEGFYKKFQEFLNFMYNSGKKCEILSKKQISEESLTKIQVIYQHSAPIILWYEYIDENFRMENRDDLFFKINFDTKTSVGHFLEKVVNENILKRVMGNICIIYLPFGIDLYKERKLVRDLLIDKPDKYVLVKKNLNFEENQKEKDSSVIISNITKILCNKNDALNEKYLLFGKMLHYFVSTKISKGNMITQVFMNNENNIEWCDVDNRFIIKDSENNLNRKSILKLASPFFVWIAVVNKLESTEYNETFYFDINDIREKIINYLVKNQDNNDEENDILIKMRSVYDPIEQYFDTNETLHDYPKNYKYFDIFKKLVDHYVIGRKRRRFSYSFIFQYYFETKIIGKFKEYKGQISDIFNFCGAFYIFVYCFENNSDNLFYKNVKIITDKITDYIIYERKERLENKIELEKKIIEKMKFVFDEIENKSDLENKISKQMKLLIHKIYKHFNNYIIQKVLNKREDCSDFLKKIAGEMKLFNNIEYKTNRKKIMDEMKLKFLEISDYMIGKIQKTVEDVGDLQNEIIYGMKYLFPDCSEFISSDYKNFPGFFSQIYSYVVKSRPNVEISFIDSEEELDEIRNADLIHGY